MFGNLSWGCEASPPGTSSRAPCTPKASRLPAPATGHRVCPSREVAARAVTAACAVRGPARREGREVREAGRELPRWSPRAARE